MDTRMKYQVVTLKVLVDSEAQGDILMGELSQDPAIDQYPVLTLTMHPATFSEREQARNLGYEVEEK